MNKRIKKKFQKKRDNELKDKLLYLYNEAKKADGALIVVPEYRRVYSVINREMSFDCGFYNRPIINLTADLVTQYDLDRFYRRLL